MLRFNLGIELTSKSASEPQLGTAPGLVIKLSEHSTFNGSQEYLMLCTF